MPKRDNVVSHSQKLREAAAVEAEKHQNIIVLGPGAVKYGCDEDKFFVAIARQMGLRRFRLFGKYSRICSRDDHLLVFVQHDSRIELIGKHIMTDIRAECRRVFGYDFAFRFAVAPSMFAIDESPPPLEQKI